MSGPPKGQPWIWLTRDLLRSAEWQGLGINARRLIDFLLIEHMNHGGKKNGFLLAPREHLEEFGISHRHITNAIQEVRDARLIEVKRGTGRRPSTFALTWLPVAGSEGDRQGGPKGPYNARSRVRRDTATAENKGVRRDPPYRSSYRDGGITTDLSGAEPAAEVTDTGDDGGTATPRASTVAPRFPELPEAEASEEGAPVLRTDTDRGEKC